MRATPPMTLEAAIRDSGEDWLIESFAPPDRALEHLRRTLAAVHAEARTRLGPNAPDLTEASILAEYARNPARVRGFFQALGGTRTPQMLLMAWRIIQGMEIKSVGLTYERRSSFGLTVTLISPYGEGDETYLSTNINDFVLFRHIGIIEIDNGPVFDGFYPLKLRPV